MSMRVVVNGREVTNPVVRAAVGSVMMSLIALLLALFFFVLLPVIGVAVGLGLGIAGVVGGTLGIGLPMLRRRALAARTAEPPLDESMRVEQVRRLGEGDGR